MFVCLVFLFCFFFWWIKCGENIPMMKTSMKKIPLCDGSDGIVNWHRAMIRGLWISANPMLGLIGSFWGAWVKETPDSRADGMWQCLFIYIVGASGPRLILWWFWSFGERSRYTSFHLYHFLVAKAILRINVHVVFSWWWQEGNQGRGIQKQHWEKSRQLVGKPNKEVLMIWILKFNCPVRELGGDCIVRTLPLWCVRIVIVTVG